jgi:hypothetical protein
MRRKTKERKRQMKKETEQIQTLHTYTKAALKAFNHMDEKDITEPEVLFRYRTVQGFLIMSINDIGRCLQTWLDEDHKEAAQEYNRAKQPITNKAGQNADPDFYPCGGLR